MSIRLPKYCFGYVAFEYVLIKHKVHNIWQFLDDYFRLHITKVVKIATQAKRITLKNEKIGWLHNLPNLLLLLLISLSKVSQLGNFFVLVALHYCGQWAKVSLPDLRLRKLKGHDWGHLKFLKFWDFKRVQRGIPPKNFIVNCQAQPLLRLEAESVFFSVNT